MPRTHPPYPPEFRAEAVRLARGSDRSIPALAADLGISSEALRHWLRQDDADTGRGQLGVLTSDEREELRRLRREVKVLQQEREILKSTMSAPDMRGHENAGCAILSARLCAQAGRF
jgi:transposase-like protein